MADRKDIAELAKILHEKGYTVDSLKAAVGRRFDDGGAKHTEEQPADGGTLEPAVVKPAPVTIRLYHQPISKATPISHSVLKSIGVFPQLTISKGSSDPTYNLLFDNCSDETGYFLNDVYKWDFTSGITTPIGLNRAFQQYLDSHEIPYSSYKSGSTPEGDVIETQIPWYDYRTATDRAHQRMMDSAKLAIQKIEDKEQRDAQTLKVRNNFNRAFPKLQWYLDASGNVIHRPNAYATGGPLDGGQTPPDTLTDGDAITDAERGLAEWREQHYGANQATQDLFLKPVGNALADALYPTEYEGFTPDAIYDKVDARGISFVDPTYSSRVQLEKDILNLKNARAHSSGDRYIPGTKLRNPLFLADKAIANEANSVLRYYDMGAPANVQRKPLMEMGDNFGYFEGPFNISLRNAKDEDALYHEYSHLMDSALSRRVEPRISVYAANTNAGANLLLPSDTQKFLSGLESNNSYYKYVRNPTEVTARLHDFRRRNGIDVNKRDFTGESLKTGNYIHDITFTQLVDAFAGDYDALAKALNETYAEGGLLDKEPEETQPVDTARLRQLVDRINRTSNADFVKRLLDKNRKVLDNGDGSVSTHELSYATDENGNAVVFPEVQSDDAGFLNRYPWPLSYDRAVQRGDTLMMSVPDAELFTKDNYKMMYPHGNGFATGGDLEGAYDENTEEPLSDSYQRDNTNFNTPFVPVSLADIDTATEIRIPERPSGLWFESKAKELNAEKASSYFNGKSEDEIRNIQRKLADSGCFDDLGDMSRSQIRAVQKKLIKKGLLSDEKRPDGSYKEADGIAGPKTKAAYAESQVDGIAGPATKKAFAKYYNSDGSIITDKMSASGISGCAEYVSKKFDLSIGNSKQSGVYGDAWTMPMNIVHSGGDLVFNLYDLPEFQNVKTPAELKNLTREAVKANPVDYKSLQPGDVVGIFFPGSTHHSDVLRDGTTYNTHVGIVVDIDNDGMPIVDHNIGGKAHRNRADSLGFGAAISVVTRPRIRSNNNVAPYPFKMGKSKLQVDLASVTGGKIKQNQADKLTDFMNAMAGAAKPIGQIYKNADMDEVQKIATSVLLRETRFMQNTESTRTGFDKLKVDIEKFGRHLLLNESPETKSSDLTKFKFSTLTPAERQWLDIKTPADLEDPVKAGRASLLILAKNYDYFIRYAKENPKLGLTKQDISDLVALSYNQGMRNLSTIGSARIGSDGNRYLWTGSLDKIRESAENTQAVDDFGATKLGRIAGKIPELAGLMHFLYNAGAGDRSVSYSQRARQARGYIKDV